MRRVTVFGLLAALALGAALAARPAAGQQGAPTRRELMRTKLQASQHILEGITLENYDLIAKGARALKALSRASIWEVPTIPNADDYLVYTAEFERLADELSRKAADRNLDGATLAYFRLTASCVNCHKYIRSFDR